MKTKRDELQIALERVKPGLANKELITQSTSFAFMNEKVVTYNDEISISHPIKGLDLTGAIKAEELYQFLSKIEQEEINITWDEKQFKITAGRFKAGLILQEEIRLPVEEIGKIGEWKSLPDNFVKGIQFCRTSCSKDIVSRPILTCVNIKENGMIEASDGHRLTTYDLKTEMPVKSFLISANSTNELIKYDIKQIAEGEGWIHFRTEDKTIFSCRLFNDSYPDTNHLLEVEGKKVRLSKKMPNAVDRAQVFAKRDFNSDSEVKVKIKDKQMTISAQADFGWFEETIRTKYNEEPIEFHANPFFLAEMLDKVQHCTFGQEKIRFDGDNWVHVVALMVKQRVEE